MYSSDDSETDEVHNADFNGNWIQKSIEGDYEGFLMDICVGSLARRAAKLIYVDHHITQDGDNMSVKVINPGSGEVEAHQKYTVGGNFTDTYTVLTGKVAEVTTEWELGKIKETHTCPRFTYTLVRELRDKDTMVLHLKSSKHIKCKHIYKRM